MLRSHIHNQHPVAFAAFQAEVCNAFIPFAEDWVKFLVSSSQFDQRLGYGAFWSGPMWFARELGQPLLNDAGRHFEAKFWLAQLQSGMVQSKTLLEREKASFDGIDICDCWNPVDYWGSLIPPYETLIGIDHRACAHVDEMLQQHRHFEHEINAECFAAAYPLLNSGTDTPEPIVMHQPLESRPPLTRNSAVALASDQHYWFARYWNPLVVGSEPTELAGRRWYAELIPILAPEFVLDKRLSAPRSSAYVKTADGDWVWAILSETLDRFSVKPPVLALLWQGPKSRFKGVEVWRLPTGSWFKQRYTSYVLSRSPRGIEIGLRWSVMHFKRVIRFYELGLIAYFAGRGDTLLPLVGA